MPCISSFVTLPLPISSPRYTCLLSAEITSPAKVWASLIDKDVLPEAVGPTMIMRGCLSMACSGSVAKIAEKEMPRPKRTWLVRVLA